MLDCFWLFNTLFVALKQASDIRMDLVRSGIDRRTNKRSFFTDIGIASSGAIKILPSYYSEGDYDKGETLFDAIFYSVAIPDFYNRPHTQTPTQQQVMKIRALVDFINASCEAMSFVSKPKLENKYMIKTIWAGVPPSGVMRTFLTCFSNGRAYWSGDPTQAENNPNQVFANVSNNFFKNLINNFEEESQ